MGYTHYWKLFGPIDKETFGRIVNDFKKVLPVLDDLGVELAAPGGAGKPVITDAAIEFNGVTNCGHARRDLGIAWPAEDARGVCLAYAENSNGGADVGGAWFAGRTILSRSCGGDCSHESFHLTRTGEETPGKASFHFCKTAFKPYDLAVTSCLVIANHHLGDKIDISSDGKIAQWRDAMAICSATLGYGDDFWLSA